MTTNKRTLYYRNHQISEGDIFYMTDYIIPIKVVAIYQNNKPVASVVLSYDGTDFIQPADVVFNRIIAGSYAFGGNPRYTVGKRLSTPTTSNLVTILGISDREGIVEGAVAGSSFAQYHYFVQLVEADGKITYTVLTESMLARYDEIDTVVIRPLPDVMEEDAKLIDIGEITIDL